MLHKICNFLKHNSKEAYNTIKNLYPDNVRSKEKGTASTDFENGMFAGDWIIIKEGYIDKTLKQLKIFFADYCKVYLKEDVDNAYWNYDDYFKDAVSQMRYPYDYWGI